LAQQQFSQETANRLLNAVYAVASIDGDKPYVKATAFAVSTNMLATSGDVTTTIAGSESEYVLLAPNDQIIRIKSVKTHPGYQRFKNYLSTLGTVRWGDFRSLDLINEYGVGIIEIDPATPLPLDPAVRRPATLDVASAEDLRRLGAGFPIASAGFPVEGIAGMTASSNSPMAILQFGHISLLLDAFMSRTDDWSQRTLIVHNLPATGGQGGSPLLDPHGKVIGIVTGGNTTRVVTGVTQKTSGDLEVDTVRIPNAALVNYAQRADVLMELIEGRADTDLERKKLYWDETAKKYVSVFEDAEKGLRTLVEGAHSVTAPTKQEIGSGTLRPRNPGRASFDSQSHNWTLQPGHLYGFIANSKDGIPIALSVKKKGTSDYLDDEAAPQQAPGLGPVPKTSSPTPTALISVSEPTEVEIDVFGILSLPAEYALHALTWDELKPTEIPSAGGSSTPEQQ
jgi:hypothetical protein